VDAEYADFTAEMYAEGHSFLHLHERKTPTRYPAAADCATRSRITGFSYTLGAGGVSTGSKKRV